MHTWRDQIRSDNEFRMFQKWDKEDAEKAHDPANDEDWIYRRHEMRGLHKLSGASNTVQAWADWRWYEQRLIDAGLGDMADKHRPPEGAGWRVVDRHIKAMRQELETMKESEA